jgi:hypothetical protein
MDSDLVKNRPAHWGLTVLSGGAMDCPMWIIENKSVLGKLEQEAPDRSMAHRIVWHGPMTTCNNQNDNLPVHYSRSGGAPDKHCSRSGAPPDRAVFVAFHQYLFLLLGDYKYPN